MVEKLIAASVTKSEWAALAMLAGSVLLLLLFIPKAAGKLPEKIIGKDGAPMVLVPAGPFTMGSEGSGEDEKPLHRVYLDAFYMDQYEVTTKQFARFLEKSRRKPPDHWSAVRLPQLGNRPVVGVDWHNADAYCRWAERRLPSEAEWEKAARGPEVRAYPWGEDIPNASLANFDKSCILCNVYEEVLKPVGSYEKGKSPYGIYDMAGNVLEWTADWYDERYYKRSPDRNPAGPSQGLSKVVRGGSWLSRRTLLQTGLRNWESPASRSAHVGFRCAQDAQK